MHFEVTAYGVTEPQQPVEPLKIPRRQPTEFDVLVGITYCGVCHSDKHHIFNDWGDAKYPLVPGHEIVGIVQEIGANVSKFKVGDYVAIGNMTDSCKHCTNCEKSAEQYCLNNGPTWVYNGRERIQADGGRTLKPTGDPTFGGYSTAIVAQEDFVFLLPKELTEVPERAASLLCAGITVYYPLKYWKIGKGHRVGIAGIGGLGHLGIKFAKALGAEVVGIATTPDKLADIVALGADDALLMDEDFALSLEAKEKENMEKPLDQAEQEALGDTRLEYKDYFDIIISTVPTTHDVSPYLRLLKPGQSKLHIVGNMNQYPHLKGMDFVFYGKDITTSNVGGLADTKEMLDFCAKHRIVADVEVISTDQINKAIKSMVMKRARYRYVIDLS